MKILFFALVSIIGGALVILDVWLAWVFGIGYSAAAALMLAEVLQYLPTFGHSTANMVLSWVGLRPPPWALDFASRDAIRTAVYGSLGCALALAFAACLFWLWLDKKLHPEPGRRGGRIYATTLYDED